jgi:hypothetical protein
VTWLTHAERADKERRKLAARRARAIALGIIDPDPVAATADDMGSAGDSGFHASSAPLSYAEKTIMDAKQALAAYVADLPKPRWVWRQVLETLSREPRTALLTVTPETARAWLECRVSPVYPDRLTASRYAETMRAGLWRPRDEEPIELKVSDAGDACVVEGQHRLLGVVLAGLPVDLRVRFA